MDLQKRCHELIESNKHNPQIQLSAIAELHRLNITLSNYVEIIPNVINGPSPTIPTNTQDKTVSTEPEESRNSVQSNSSSLDILKDKPFWIWDKTEHLRLAKESNSNCCFQHIVKPPVDKTGRERPLWDYQKQIIDTLMLESLDKKDSFKNKHLYLLKSAGLEIRTMSSYYGLVMSFAMTITRIVKWLLLQGPNWDLSIKLMKRLKAIFEPKLNIIFQDKETVLEFEWLCLGKFYSK